MCHEAGAPGIPKGLLALWDSSLPLGVASEPSAPLCTPVSSAHLDHAIQGLLVLGPEYLPNVQHVQLTAGDHDTDQGVVPSPQALENKWVWWTGT